jgi:hypothetical protein
MSAVNFYFIMGLILATLNGFTVEHCTSNQRARHFIAFVAGHPVLLALEGMGFQDNSACDWKVAP